MTLSGSRLAKFAALRWSAGSEQRLSCVRFWL